MCCYKDVHQLYNFLISFPEEQTKFSKELQHAPFYISTWHHMLKTSGYKIDNEHVTSIKQTVDYGIAKHPAEILQPHRNLGIP